MPSFRILLLLLPVVLSDPPFLFPHGYFDSNKLKPFDSIYLNLMAASNLEYGGTTLGELDALDASRKLIPRPEELARKREEDDPTLDREPIAGDDANPFEKIATRAPPRANSSFQQLRRQLKKNRKAPKTKAPRRAKKAKKLQPTTAATAPPTLIPTVIPKLRRLPNNPYGSLNIREPNVLPLPIPPDFL